MRLDQYNNKGFNPSEFVEFLSVRKIPFQLYFIPEFKKGIRENLRHLKVIVSLNLRMRKVALKIRIT